MPVNPFHLKNRPRARLQQIKQGQAKRGVIPSVRGKDDTSGFKGRQFKRA